MRKAAGVSRAMFGLLSAFVAAVISFTPARAVGQAQPTATRAIGFAAFGGYSYLKPDSGSGGSGFFVGADIDKRYRQFDASLEGRYWRGSGSAVSEHTLAAGPKLGIPLGRTERLEPYVNFLVGYGVIDFKYPAQFGNTLYTADNSIVYSIGGGLDYHVTSQWTAKVDYQYSFWKLGTQAGENNGLHPTALNVGALYRFSFHKLRGNRF